MKLTHEFHRLPLRFDAERLRDEVLGLPEAAWVEHPTGYTGNTAARLITRDGQDNDEVSGPMRATPLLSRLPYVQQVLASFGVVWSRSRLMKLAPGARVPQHCDVSYHWRHRVRIHIPVVTFPEVRFYCGERSVNMAAGEAWVFDNWRPHRVENPTAFERIHLVADTIGNGRFWDLVRRSPFENFEALDRSRDAHLPYRAQPQPPLIRTEAQHQAVVMPPAELESLVASLLSDFGSERDTPEARSAFARWRRILQAFCAEWRQNWALHGEGLPGWSTYAELRQQVRSAIALIEEPVYAWSNQTLAIQILESGILQHVLNPPGAERLREAEFAIGPGASGTRPAAGAIPGRAPDRGSRPDPSPSPNPAPSLRRVTLDRPLFILAAPRSGSTLLFETLAHLPSLWTLGGEAHGLVEQFEALRPGAPGVDSNRLTAAHLSTPIADGIASTLASHLRNARGESPGPDSVLRMLEKTPKNALRVPFFKALYPDARFLFLWRDPRENLASIIEAWNDGGWITYPELPAWDGPWSMLLPPGWQQLRGEPLERVAAFQWRATNEMVLDDLAALGGDEWMSLEHAEFLRDPAAAVQRICRFADLESDAGLAKRLSEPLPWSRFTRTPPAADKWRVHQDRIERVLPDLNACWDRLRAL